MQRKRLETPQPGGLFDLRLFAVIIMFVLLCAQLIWWIIFFEINYRERVVLERKLYQARLNLARGRQTPWQELKYLEFVDGKYRIKSGALQKIDAEHRRKLFMLISETFFFLTVISYGSYRVFRSIRRELKLVQDRQTFIHSVSHELKTPLSSILLGLQTLQKRKLSPEKQEELLASGVQDVRRLDAQVNNLLAAGAILRKKGKKSELAPGANEIIDLALHLNDYLTSVNNNTELNRAEIINKVRGPLEVKINPDLFRKVCDSVIQNAIQYSGESPRLIIRSKRTSGPRFFNRNRAGYILLEFIDNGPGIPTRERKNVFLPLYRLSKSRRPVRGSGMGLYIAREILRSAGGDIRIKSGEPAPVTDSDAGGHTDDFEPGAIFEVSLPTARV